MVDAKSSYAIYRRSIIKSHEHVISLMTSYNLLQMHFITEEIYWEIIEDTRSIKERKEN